ncbi:MAG: hypothetical protein ACOYXA_06120 [Bacteroidota bacterium]
MSRFSLCCIIVFVAESFSLHAQSLDSLGQKVDSLSQVKTSRYDSATERINERIDGVQNKVNQWANPDLGTLKGQLQARQKKETLQGSSSLDSTRQRLSQKIDSLKQLGQPTERWSRQLDSLNQISPQKYLQQAQGKVNQLESRINQPGDQIESKVNEKLTLMNQEGGSQVSLPGNAEIPGASVEVNVGDQLQLPKSDLDISNPLQDVENPLQEELGEVNELKGKVGEVKALPQEQIGKVKSIEEVQAVQGKVSQANTITDQVQTYGEDARNIGQGEWGEVKAVPDAMEGQVKKLEGVDQLGKQNEQLTQYQELIGKGNDPEAMKQLARQQTMTYAKNHFAGKEEVLRAAMDKMEKLKTKYVSLDSLTNLPRYRPNVMEGKPFIERLVPGITFQIQKSAYILLDYNPTVGYRITGRLSSGLGWNERIRIQKRMRFTSRDRIYGPRVFVDMIVWKGFSAHVELEKMRTLVPASLVPYADERGKAWIWSAFFGIQKRYAFTKHIKGHFQFLYNFYDDHHSSPYVDRFNARFGFELPMKVR